MIDLGYKLLFAVRSKPSSKNNWQLGPPTTVGCSEKGLLFGPWTSRLMEGSYFIDFWWFQATLQPQPWSVTCFLLWEQTGGLPESTSGQLGPRDLYRIYDIWIWRRERYEL